MPMTLTSSMDPSLLCSRSKRVWLIEAVNLPEVRGKGPSHHSRDHQGHPCPHRPRSRREGLDGADELSADRKSAVEGKSVSVRVDLGGRRIIKKNRNIRKH